MVNLLIAVTGSVATVKLKELIDKIKENDEIRFEIKVISTTHGLFFIPNDISVPILTDKDEWENWKKVGDPVLHIELRNWADIMVISPCDANTLAKIANGICDNLICCVTRAWDLCAKPLLIFPAMNTFMWNHPVTEMNCRVIGTFPNHHIFPPITKKLACGDFGIGAMANTDSIVSEIINIVSFIK